MISVEESQQLIEKLIDLRSRYRETNDPKDRKNYMEQQTLCIEKFQYLISMRTDRYKNFFNYDDLNQEGNEALLKAMNSYDPSRGTFFWWSHQYIKTRIVRSATAHSAIRYPLKFAKENPPHKESHLPLMIEEKNCPDRNAEIKEVKGSVNNAMKFLNRKQKKIISMAFGFDGDKPMSVNKICQSMNISRLLCLRVIDSAMDVLKENIKI